MNPNLLAARPRAERGGPRTAGTPAGFRFASYGRVLTGHGVRARLDNDRARQMGLAAAARELLAAHGPDSVLVGMIPFDPDADAHLYLPERAERTPMRRIPAASAPNVRIEQVRGADNPDFICAVDAAVERIAAGELEKVVLARTLEVEAGEPWDATAIWQRLYRQNPAGHSFALDTPDGGMMVGNSPELIAGVRHGQLSSHPLAGSAARHAALAADRAAAAALACSEKDLAEHAFVVRHIRQALQPLCTELNVPPRPDVLPTAQLWHLGTLLRGALRPGLGALDAALAIHPTPAICGTPTAAARRAITQLETAERGFYGGLVGWMDARGEGEWALLLRSAVLRGSRATLHAGAGIVAGSDALAEHRETATKFGTMLAGLGAAADARQVQP